MRSKLLKVLATADRNSKEYIISSYIIEHYNELVMMSDITTDYLAKQCHLSKASISRFCRDVGFGSFSVFKYMLSHQQSISMDKYKFGNKGDKLQSEFIRELEKSIEKFNLCFDQVVFDELTKDIFNYEKIIVLANQTTWPMALMLQNNLGLDFSKLVLVSSDLKEQTYYMQSGTKNDLFILLANDLQFIDQLLMITPTSSLKIYMITINVEIHHSLLYKSICLANDQSYPASLLMNIYIELLSMNYYQLMMKKRLEKELKR